RHEEQRISPSTNGSSREQLLPRGGYIALSVIMAGVSVMAIILNATVIAVTLRHRQLQQPLNYALVNLAVADLGAALCGGVPAALSNALGYHAGGWAGCVLEGFSVALFGIAALCSIALIAVERLLVVAKPLGGIRFRRIHAVLGVALSWLWSLLWNMPPLFGWGEYELEGVRTSCGPNWRSRDPSTVSYIICYFLLCFAVPFAMIVVSYSWLIWTIRQVARVGCVRRGAAAKAESKVTWMVVAMVLAFLASWLPYATLAFTVVFDPQIKISSVVAMIPVYMAKSSTIYNPLIYIFMNKQFQRYAIPFLLCGKNPWPPEEEESEAPTVLSSNRKASV
uniref:G-protein coupled receptors family 1 profile domain-containing protein n=1 Tax=Denticeps clupeoides TaxID=299321 RepID=A0AAY4AA47_9TELE